MPAPSPPDFLCIGAMKAGTTWLQVNLGRHPGAWLSPLKELRYFNVVHLEGWHRERDTAHRQQQVAAGIARLRAAAPCPRPASASWTAWSAFARAFSDLAAELEAEAASPA